MRISLVYLVIDSPQDTRYSYGLGYVAAVLKSGGHDVTCHALGDDADVRDFVRYAHDRRPGLIGLSCTSSQFAYVADIARDIKQRCECMVVCGGVHPTLRPECLLAAPDVDAVVRGEGEYPLLELASAVESGSDWRSIPNLAWREGSEIRLNPTRAFIEDLDALPMPDKTSLDYQAVIDRAGGADRFIFSRGCTFTCTYCSNWALSQLCEGPYFRQQSPSRAIDEIRRDRERFRFSRIVFDDDTITLRKDWFYEFFTQYKREFSYPFACNLRVGTVDEDMVRLLKDAGARTVVMGIEHGNEEFRRTVLKRPMSNRRIVETFDLCHRLGLETCGQAIVGFPGETPKLFRDTARLCRRVSVRNPISIFQPYPGTELGDLCERNGWLPSRTQYRERREAVIDFPGFRRRQIQLCADVFPVLTQHRWIPIGLPLSFTLRAWRCIDLCAYVCKRTFQRLTGSRK